MYVIYTYRKENCRQFSSRVTCQSLMNEPGAIPDLFELIPRVDADNYNQVILTCCMYVFVVVENAYCYPNASASNGGT